MEYMDLFQTSSLFTSLTDDEWKYSLLDFNMFNQRIENGEGKETVTKRLVVEICITEILISEINYLDLQLAN